MKPEDWKVDKKERTAYFNKLFQKQCPLICNEGMKNDKNILNILTIGQKKNVPHFLSYLSDTYSRDRLRFEDSLSPQQWALHSPYCKLLGKLTNKENVETVVSSIASFNHRVVPKLQQHPSKVINDSLSDVCDYIHAAATFVTSLTQKELGTCPFQIDFALTFDDVMVIDEADEEEDAYDADDSVDETDFKEIEFFDCFVDIKQKLTDAKVSYLAQCRGNAQEEAKLDTNTQFSSQFNMFRRKTIQQKYNFDTDEQYPRMHRFVALVDRRQPNDENAEYVADSDEILFYEAQPMTLPKEPCSLWYFESSKTCIIPGQYVPKDSKMDAMQKGMIEAKSSLDPCMGSLMLLSFHVIDSDTIKCYLYLHGQLLRLFPDDLVNVLPRYFVDDERNKKFIKSQKAKEMIESIKANLRDVQFEAFYQKYKCK